jgi:hypothetical protein
LDKGSKQSERDVGRDGGWLGAAEQLIHDVHHVLGRHRSDDERQGWISGLSEEEGDAHPTAGGLRIGKPLPERGEDEPDDSMAEWDRDGQYFHYLARWMHALHQAALATGRPEYLRWAAELVAAGRRLFVRDDPEQGRTTMVWKMSIDGERALTPVMGAQDPLDGLVTAELVRTATINGDALGDELAERCREAAGVYTSMCEGRTFATGDSLGIGGLLIDIVGLMDLSSGRGVDDGGFIDRLLGDAAHSLQAFVATDELARPIERRLAFRELGLAIGMGALEHAANVCSLDDRAQRQVSDVLRHETIVPNIIQAWRTRDAQSSQAWREHEDINAVMLASALAPKGAGLNAPAHPPA